MATRDRIDCGSISGPSLALKEDSTIWAWGEASKGQLGDNTTAFKSSPVSVVGDHSFVFLSAGFRTSYALKDNGEAWAWGQNEFFGALGDNTITNRSSPVSVVGDHAFTVISGGTWFAAALKANGEAWTWGQNSLYGRLGDNTRTDRSSPVSVVGGHAFVDISAGSGVVAAIKNNGEAWAWGANFFGSLGDNTRVNKSSPVLVIGDHSFIQIDINDRTVIGLKANGEVWAWGENTHGNVGDNSTTHRSSPVSVVGDHSFIQIAAGDDHTIGLKANGEAWTWGRNQSSELGDNTNISKSSPVSVVGDHSFIAVSAATNYSFGLKAGGLDECQLWAWGLNSTGQLGDNSTDTRSSPVLVVKERFCLPAGAAISQVITIR